MPRTDVYIQVKGLTTMYLPKYIYLLSVYIIELCCVHNHNNHNTGDPFHCCLPLGREETLTFEVKACENVHVFLTDGTTQNTPVVQLVYYIFDSYLAIETITGHKVEMSELNETVLDCLNFKPFWISRIGYSIETGDLTSNTVLLSSSDQLFSSYSVFGVCPINGHYTEWKFCPEDFVSEQQSFFVTSQVTTTDISVSQSDTSGSAHKETRTSTTDISTEALSTDSKVISTTTDKNFIASTDKKYNTTSNDNAGYTSRKTATRRSTIEINSVEIETTRKIRETTTFTEKGQSSINYTPSPSTEKTITEAQNRDVSTIQNNLSSYSRSPTLNIVTPNIERRVTSSDGSTVEEVTLQTEDTTQNIAYMQPCICDGKWSFLNNINNTEEDLMLLLRDEQTELRKILTVDKKSTSKYIRKISCASDHRHSSQSMGVMAIVVTAIPFLLATLSDIHKLYIIINIKREISNC